ncbi:hypothetical protein [Thermogemmatispora tikiterensis]|uniref:Uncharacterized protein n=1 Tax=Thermogemmatispora tikiterensis TaxID=1825093 RepID=A0A328VDL5_9CHLR|nr:hypothetical protein [Thermogemmatispora tikiterensis]RAQ94072.1 hypothetical protein A4R35_00910 [Thermogemmatispora tikiterensis]
MKCASAACRAAWPVWQSQAQVIHQLSIGELPVRIEWPRTRSSQRRQQGVDQQGPSLLLRRALLRGSCQDDPPSSLGSLLSAKS